MMLRLFNDVGEYVNDVAMTAGGARYGEPFIRSVWQNKNVFNNIGFDYTVDSEALDRLYAVMRHIWRDKALSLSVFSWQYMENGKPKSSLSRAINRVAEWKPDIIGAHDLREVPGAARKARWDAMAETGVPMYFQTAAPARIGDWTAALEIGKQYGASSIELPHSFDAWDYERLGDFAWDFTVPT